MGLPASGRRPDEQPPGPQLEHELPAEPLWYQGQSSVRNLTCGNYLFVKHTSLIQIPKPMENHTYSGFVKLATRLELV